MFYGTASFSEIISNQLPRPAFPGSFQNCFLTELGHIVFIRTGGYEQFNHAPNMRLQFWCLFVCVGIREDAPADSLEKRVPSVVGEKVGIGFAFDHGLQERKCVLGFQYRMNFMPDPKDFTALHIAAQKASLLIPSRVDDRAVQNRLVDLP